MKRHGILNRHLAKVFADLGHTDKVVIADCDRSLKRRDRRGEYPGRLGMDSAINKQPTCLDVGCLFASLRLNERSDE